MPKRKKKHKKRKNTNYNHKSESDNVTLDEFSVMVCWCMAYFNLNTLSAEYLSEIERYKFTPNPDKDFSGNKKFINFIDCVSEYMDRMGFLEMECSLNDEFTLSVFPLPSTTNTPTTVLSTETVKKHLARSVETFAKCFS